MGQTDPSDRQTTDWCFTLSVMGMASIVTHKKVTVAARQPTNRYRVQEIFLQTKSLLYCTVTLHYTRLTAPFQGLPRWAGTRKVKPIWILLKQETVSGSGISWTMCKSAPHSRQITMPAPQHSDFYRPDALPATQPTASKHWRHTVILCKKIIKISQYWRAEKQPKVIKQWYLCSQVVASGLVA